MSGSRGLTQQPAGLASRKTEEVIQAKKGIAKRNACP